MYGTVYMLRSAKCERDLMCWYAIWPVPDKTAGGARLPDICKVLPDSYVAYAKPLLSTGSAMLSTTTQLRPKMPLMVVL